VSRLKKWKWKLPEVIFHGIRLKDPDKQLSAGIKAWDSDRARSELLEAVRYFGITPYKEEVVEEFLIEIEERFREPGFWCTSDKNAVPFWAKNNPEIISMPLEIMGIEKRRIYEYLEKRYGHPCALVISVPRIVDILGEKRVRYMFLSGGGGANLFLPLAELSYEVVKFWYPV